MEERTPKTPRLDELLCFSLYSAAQAMNRVYQPLLEPHGLTYPQYAVLVALWEKDARPVGELGRQLGLESNTLTPLLKRMEQTGLVTRARSTEDERRVIVALGARGRALRTELAHIPGCIGAATGMTRDEAVALRAEIAALRDRLSAAGMAS